MKNNKGVTLLILTITIIVILIITSITIYNATGQIAIKNVNNLYSDIDSISTKVSDYYLNNNDLPIFEEESSTTSSYITKADFIDNFQGVTLNPNDDDYYYVIDLSKLNNLTLNYGKDFVKWKSDPSLNYTTSKDVYIINKVTHQIYYPKGIKMGDTVYYTNDLDVEKVEKIETTKITDDGLTLTINQSNKNTISEETNVVIEVKITLILSDDFQKDTLKYGWKVASDTSDTSDITYTQFSLDNANSATLTSKPLDDTTEYYLYIKILDTNGDEHVKTYDLNFKN